MSAHFETNRAAFFEFAFDTVAIDADAYAYSEDDVCMLAIVDKSIDHSNNDEN